MKEHIEVQFLQFILAALTGDPNCFEIKRSLDERGVFLQVIVGKDHGGRIIGKRGATAQSLRTLLRALGSAHDARYNLKILDPSEVADSAQPTCRVEGCDQTNIDYSGVCPNHR